VFDFLLGPDPIFHNVDPAVPQIIVEMHKNLLQCPGFHKYYLLFLLSIISTRSFRVMLNPDPQPNHADLKRCYQIIKHNLTVLHGKDSNF
jgi:hypothetical protein